MLKIYGAGASRWAKCIWLLNELGVPYERKVMNFREAEHRQPEYLQKNPFGKAPVLEDEGTTLYESNAILNYLGEKYSYGKLIPRSNTAERAQYDQWMFFIASEIEQPVWHWFRHSFFFDDSRASEAEKNGAIGDLRKISETLDGLLTRNHLVGDKFTCADINLTYTLHWGSTYGMLDALPNLKSYVEHHIARSAFPMDLFDKK